MEYEGTFTGSAIKDGVLFDLSRDRFSCYVNGWAGNEYRCKQHSTTTYGYVFSGKSTLTYRGLRFPLAEGMYFAVPGEFSINGGEGILIEYANYNGFFQIGGAIEKTGRLKYINGCMDSLLISPVRKGEPCLNSLYFPSGIVQTAHTHPSYRIGLVVEGMGECITSLGRGALRAGMAFVIQEGMVHSFKTAEEEYMIVLTFHPDSDFGPEDENHPMINRTIVEGISANQKSEILTDQ